MYAICQSLDFTDAYDGVKYSIAYYFSILSRIAIILKNIQADLIDCTPLDYILDCRERLLLSLQPQAKKQKCPSCLKVYSDFMAITTRGVVAVIDGNMMGT